VQYLNNMASQSLKIHVIATFEAISPFNCMHSSGLPEIRTHQSLESCQQSFSDQKDIRQGKQHLALRVILFQTLVEHLLEAEQILDDMEGMLHAGAHLGLEPFQVDGHLTQRFVLNRPHAAALVGDTPVNCQTLQFLTLLCAGVTGIGTDPGLFAMQQVVRLSNEFALNNPF
jgi:hypothetical protein